MHRDNYYMKMALDLAKKGGSSVSPNPLVGAVIVKNNRVAAKGYHKRVGFSHAEVVALNKAGNRARNATLYVNLEPCNHFGKTPPCTDRIIQDGIKRVVIGMKDPNPINNGKGIRRLRRCGIKVSIGCMEREARALNRSFATYITKKRPHIIIKAAQTLDGKIATVTGNSKWITNPSSRRFVHSLRSNVDAVLIGVNTVIRDNPLLTSRMAKNARQPVRIVLDSRLRIPLKSRILRNGSSKVMIVTTDRAPRRRIEELTRKGIEVITTRGKRGMVNLNPFLRYLAKCGISRLLVEGGGNVISSFITEGIADDLLIFIAPKIIGGSKAPTSVEGAGISSLDRAIRLKDISIKRFEQDILIRGHVYRHN